MELLILILAFITIPAIIYQAIVIEKLEEDRKHYISMLEHRDKIIAAYIREINKGE